MSTTIRLIVLIGAVALAFAIPTSIIFGLKP